MEEKSELKISESVSLVGKHPVVIIGTNGSGKTRLGARLSKENDCDWIPALRNLSLVGSVPMQTTEKAKNEVRGHVSQLKKEPWRLADEFGWMIAQLLAEDSESAMKYRNECMLKPGAFPPETAATKLVAFWNRVFPGRTIDLSSYKPTVTSKLTTPPISYPAQQMSDGERAAMYLAARVISASAGLVIIDEPEVHFHSILAKRFWNELEQMRSDCRFVYITHDLPFALSRRSAQFVIAKCNVEPVVLPQQTNIPEELVENILGGASFSVSASRIVFCEGNVGGPDEALYEAWFEDNDTTVVPVGNWENVVKSVDVFNSSGLIVGANAIGIVDRDYWPNQYLTRLPPGVHVLYVHELEGLFCLRGVFTAVAKYLQIPEEDINNKYDQFLEKARACFKNAMFNKQVLERAKRRLETDILRAVNNVRPDVSLEDVKAKFVDGLDPDKWPFSSEKIFEEEITCVKGSLEQGEEEILKILPGKSYCSHAANELGLSWELFQGIIISALSLVEGMEKETELINLKKELVMVLREQLPPRKADKENSKMIPEQDN